MSTRTVAAGIVGFGLWLCLVLGFSTAAILLAWQIGLDPRLWSFLGAPLGMACAWFFGRGPGRRWPLRYGPAGAVPATVLAAVFHSSEAFGVFTFSFCAGLLGAPLAVLLTQMLRRSPSPQA